MNKIELKMQALNYLGILRCIIIYSYLYQYRQKTWCSKWGRHENRHSDRLLGKISIFTITHFNCLEYFQECKIPFLLFLKDVSFFIICIDLFYPILPF